jgi:very-short-patch-repair endonuclease
VLPVCGGCHKEWKQKEEDGFREESLRSAGWEVVIVWNTEIVADLESVGHRVLAKLLNRKTTSTRTRRSLEPF